MTPRAYEEARARTLGERAPTPGATGRKAPARLPRQSKAVYGWDAARGILTVPYPPTGALTNGRLKAGEAGQLYESRDSMEWQKQIHAEFRWPVGPCRHPLTGPVVVTLWVYRPRRCADADSCLKGCLDALTGYWYVDDSQVRDIHVYRRDDPLAARVEVEVRAWEGDGGGGK